MITVITKVTSITKTNNVLAITLINKNKNVPYPYYQGYQLSYDYPYYQGYSCSGGNYDHFDYCYIKA